MQRSLTESLALNQRQSLLWEDWIQPFSQDFRFAQTGDQDRVLEFYNQFARLSHDILRYERESPGDDGIQTLISEAQNKIKFMATLVRRPLRSKGRVADSCYLRDLRSKPDHQLLVKWTKVFKSFLEHYADFPDLSTSGELLTCVHEKNAAWLLCLQRLKRSGIFYNLLGFAEEAHLVISGPDSGLIEKSPYRTVVSSNPDDLELAIEFIHSCDSQFDFSDDLSRFFKGRIPLHTVWKGNQIVAACLSKNSAGSRSYLISEGFRESEVFFQNDYFRTGKAYRTDLIGLRLAPAIPEDEKEKVLTALFQSVLNQSCSSRVWICFQMRRELESVLSAIQLDYYRARYHTFTVDRDPKLRIVPVKLSFEPYLLS